MLKALHGTVETFKNVVHPKMKIMSLFIHPHLIPNLFDFYLLLKRKCFFLSIERKSTILDPIHFNCMNIIFFKKYIILGPTEKKKVKQVWNNMRVNK